MFQLTDDRTEGNRRGGFLETRAWSRMFLRISNNNLPALAQTLPDEAPPMDKTHPFSKIAVTFEPVMRFGCPLGFRISLEIVT